MKMKIDDVGYIVEPFGFVDRIGKEMYTKLIITKVKIMDLTEKGKIMFVRATEDGWEDKIEWFDPATTKKTVFKTKALAEKAGEEFVLKSIARQYVGCEEE